MCKRFCRCFSLAFGSYIVGCVTVGSSVVGAVHIFEELTTITDTWMESTSEGVFDFMTLVALCLHTVLCVIGIVILYGLIHNKIKLVKYASLALLVASIFRLVVAIVRLIVSQDIEAFLFFFVNGSFYLYGFVVIWSFAVDEEESQRLNILANYEIAQIAQRFGHRSSICTPNN
ncbi:uncharacterized protein LOC129000682 [Macrosteles quadrilineatus]|uniref:uncharacterized protein LOC129000682 n=1 Tax=Macrosteles quadrilineatus TaxID=74068 RepID=UPI0023E1EE35|nr:uncharacterized protein LOC129000682 [Macrosteles quadrilineatus]